MNDRIAEVRAAYNRCFGCGTDNPIGLGLDDFVREGSIVRAQFSPRSDFNGFSTVLHGGIVATALDEIMAWAAILVEETMVVTGTLDLRFRKPAELDKVFDLEGELLQRRGRRLQIEGRMRQQGTLIAQASGMFIAVTETDLQ